MAAKMSGTGKLDEVTRLVDRLTADLEEISLQPHQRDAYLEQLKVFGRDPTDAEPIFTKEGIETLTRHAFNSPSKTTSRNALRCLANALLLKPETRQIFINLGYEARACDKLKEDSRDDEFLVSRVIFLTTYDSKVDIETLIDQHNLASLVCQNIARHTRQYVAEPKKVKELDPMEDMALVESLKLLFNLTHFCPQRIQAFSSAVPHILMLLSKQGISSRQPLDPPIGPLVNSLINLEFEDKNNITAMFPKATPNVNAERLIHILDMAIGVYADEELEQLVSPLLTLIRKVYGVAPQDVQKSMRKLILPSQEDRKLPVGRGHTLSARILRLSTIPAAPQVREVSSSLLFEMSDKDARSFVQNVGYGFASGFLFQHNVPIPENAMEAWSTSGSEDNGRANDDSWKSTNPITGQLLAEEPQVDLPEMSQEEKEREAEKLFVLFERLKKNGIIKAQNPVETAFHEGRFQELDDDADDE
ncbi:hypothetical protein B7494_g3234 [Chlorociboria aeruginascens]|nr:hypothetical protein B7494_g3234 [Chlorociboria aeruginascens]